MIRANRDASLRSLTYVTVLLGPFRLLSRSGLKSLDAQLTVTADQRDSDVLRGRVQSMRLRSGGAQVLEFP